MGGAYRWERQPSAEEGWHVEARFTRSTDAQSATRDARMASRSRMGYMNSGELKRKLISLFDKADICDLNWLASLLEFDEVPLFSRASDIAFLQSEPATNRNVAFLDSVVVELDKVATVIDSLDRRADYFLCLTFLDWDLVIDGGQAVPTPSVFISPRWTQELKLPRWVPAMSEEARLIESWAEPLNRSDICVADALRDGSTDEPLRVYLGFRRGFHEFMSIGDFERSGRRLSDS